VGSVQEQEFYRKLNEELGGFIDGMNAACGTKIAGVYDNSFRGHWDMSESYGMNGSSRDACTQMVAQVRMLCEPATSNPNPEPAKKAIAAKIKRIECSLATDGKARAAFKGTTLVGFVPTPPQGAPEQDMAASVGPLLRSKL
jgi:hypothetical protein